MIAMLRWMEILSEASTIDRREKRLQKKEKSDELLHICSFSLILFRANEFDVSELLQYNRMISNI
jgi:hypothetical protein